MSLAAAQRGIDYSYSRPSLAEAVKAGSGFVVRYSAGAATAPSHSSHAINSGKLITPAEHKAILASGQDVVANDEWYTTRITERVVLHPDRGPQQVKGLEALMLAAKLDLGDKLPDDHPDMLTYVSSAARADSAAALALWRSCGHAKGSSIYVSWDAAPVTSKWAAVDAYLDTYDTGLGGYYHADCYAGSGYLRHALGLKLIRFGWRPNAGSWSGDGLPYQPDTSSAAKRAALVKLALSKTPAAIWQTGNYWFGKNADENMLLRPQIGSHMQAAATPPPKPPASGYYHDDGRGATAMVSPNGNWASFLTDDGRIDVREYDPKVGHGVHRRYA
jgi:hypothetical protein